MSIRKYIDIINESSELGDPQRQMSYAGINYDQVNGHGNVSINANIKYIGFACFMKPKHFLSMARFRDFKEDSSVEFLMEAIINGEPIGSPFLDLDLDEDHPETAPRIMQHEGRTRMEAIRRLYGEIPVMVHGFPRGGMRARHIKLEHIKTFQKLLVPEGSNETISGNYCSDTVYLDGWKSL